MFHSHMVQWCSGCCKKLYNWNSATWKTTCSIKINGNDNNLFPKDSFSITPLTFLIITVTPGATSDNSLLTGQCHRAMLDWPVVTGQCHRAMLDWPVRPVKNMMGNDNQSPSPSLDKHKPAMRLEIFRQPPILCWQLIQHLTQRQNSTAFSFSIPKLQGLTGTVKLLHSNQ